MLRVALGLRVNARRADALPLAEARWVRLASGLASAPFSTCETVFDGGACLVVALNPDGCINRLAGARPIDRHSADPLR
jgi:hypothetical protein